MAAQSYKLSQCVSPDVDSAVGLQCYASSIDFHKSKTSSAVVFD